MKYDQHIKLTASEAARYAKEKLPDFFADEEKLAAEEIGNGNINYVFRVTDEKGASLIIKQAESLGRQSQKHLSTDRIRIEAQVLRMMEKFSPGHAPKVYFSDPVMCTILMEDVGDHENLRHGLMKRTIYRALWKQLGACLAEYLMPTTDLLQESRSKRKQAAEFLNPDLCDISERLVFTEPYFTGGSNQPFGPNESFLEREYREDLQLQAEVTQLKMGFLCHAQALIHGDLHTGSVFVRENSFKILDPEFAFYGPVGYDLGNLLAHVVLSWTAARVSMEEGTAKREFLGSLENAMDEILLGFRSRVLVLAPESLNPMYCQRDFLDAWIDSIFIDSAGYCGTEILRRIIGIAKAEDILILEENERILAERIAVVSAKRFIKERSGFIKSGQYQKILRQTAEALERKEYSKW